MKTTPQTPVDLEQRNSDALSMKRSLTTSDYLKAGAVLLGTGAAYGLAKATGAWAWLWSGMSVEDTATSSEVQVVDTTDVVTVTHSVINHEVPIESSTAVLSRIPADVDGIDTLGLIEVEEEPILDLSPHRRQPLVAAVTDVFDIESSYYYARYPATTLLGTEKLVVIFNGWSGSLSSSAPRYRAYDLDGNEVFRKTLSFVYKAKSIDVEALNAGEFVVALDELSGERSYSVIFDENGNYKSEREIGTSTTSIGKSPRAVRLNNDTFAIIWKFQTSSLAWNIWYKVYSNNHDELLPSTNIVYDLVDSPDIDAAALDSGDLIITWSNQDIFARRFNSSALPSTEIFKVNTDSLNNHAVAIASVPLGGFIIVWESGVGSYGSIYGQRFDFTNLKQGNEFLIKAAESRAPSVISFDRDFIVTWTSQLDSVNGIDNQQYSLTGIKVGNNTVVANDTTVQSSYVSTISLNNHSFFTVWEQEDEIYARIMSINASYFQTVSLENNFLSISDGQTIRINISHINVVRFDLKNPDISTLIPSNVQHGYFSLVSDIGIPINQFSQTQIIDNQVRFVHDRSNQAPTFSIGVHDGEITYSSKSATITFDESPRLNNNLVTVHGNHAVTVTSTMLSATDDNVPTGNLIFSVINLQNGQFELVSNPGSNISTWNQLQVQSGQIQFANYNNIQPSYQIIISGDGLDSLPIAGMVDFNQQPVITTNQLTINQDETVLITSSMLAVDDDQDPSDLIFTISDRSGGHFSFFPGTPAVISQFDAAEIEAKEIVFVQDGSASAPVYTVEVSDGILTSAPSPAAITFNARPTILYNSLYITDSNLVINITTSDIKAEDDQPDDELTFSATAIQNGHFELTTNPGSQVTQFTQANINAGQVQFIRDSSAVLPAYSLTVSDGVLNSSPATPLTVTDNERPTVSANNLNLKQGDSITITSAMLQATDDTASPSELTFTVGNIMHGQFELSTNSGTAVTSFNQQQVNAGLVRFIHDGSSQAPSYQITVSDGQLDSAPNSATISFNQRPQLVTNQLTINDGETVTLTSTMLSTTDDSNPANLIYTISNIQHGQFERTTNPGTTITTFNQQEINDGTIRFVHDNSGQTPSYAAVVTDGVMTTPVTTATIDFNVRPTLINNQLRIKEGDTTTTITSDMLNVADDDAPENIVFSIISPQHGHFVKTSNPLQAIEEFTQADINAGIIAFVHTNSAEVPSYAVSVSDGRLTSALSTATVTINQKPVFENNRLILSQGDKVTLTTTMLSIADDAVATDLAISASAIQQGQFELTTSPDSPITQFTLAQVDAGEVRFIHDGGTLPPSYKLSVTDGTFTTTAESAAVTFNLLPVLKNNRLTINQGETVTLTTAMLSGEDSEASAIELTFTVNDVTGGQFTLISDSAVSITSFTQAQIEAGQVQFIQNGADVAPSYTVSLSDGLASISAQRAIVNYQSNPELSGGGEGPTTLETVGKAFGGSIGGLVITTLLYAVYKNTHEKDVSVQKPLAFGVYKKLRLSLSHISARNDVRKRDLYIGTMDQLSKSVEQELKLSFHKLHRSSKPEDQAQFAHFVALFALGFEHHVEIRRSQVCGLQPPCCLKSYELIEADLTDPEKQQKIVRDVIQGTREKTQILSVSALRDFFFHPDPRRRASTIGTAGETLAHHNQPGIQIEMISDPEKRAGEMIPDQIEGETASATMTMK